MGFSEVPKRITWETVPENWHFAPLKCMACREKVATHFCKFYTDGEHLTVALCDSCMRLPETVLREYLLGDKEVNKDAMLGS